ncbi:hypothetical protein HYH03_002259 [Edaphochlamys debaryana]|uniref:J domain-containing protein n=1 Tax=Edaphochlamys debaryana TaxID=47281 RepID=A0A836C5L5_9CHLO|nr:hypothetical protein HYH03_002259 [Edaphochlamys debaryana]|eukprot:KAG2499974.1 hypothetical protein HYH03_002259 [Edaphochlamys debaryana]
MAQFGYKGPRGVAAALLMPPSQSFQGPPEAQARNAQLEKEVQRLQGLLAAERAKGDELKEWDLKLKEKERALNQRDEDTEVKRLNAQYVELSARYLQQQQEIEEYKADIEAWEEEVEQEKARAQAAQAEAAALRRKVEELDRELAAYKAGSGKRPQKKKRGREPSSPPRHGPDTADDNAEPPPAQPTPPEPNPAADEVFAAAKPPTLNGSLSVPVLRQFLTQAGADAELRFCTEKEELIALAGQRVNAWHVRRAAACSRLPLARGDRALFWLDPGSAFSKHGPLAKAFRELCLRLHPDKNPGDALATPAFQYLQEAHERMKKAARA